MKFNSWQDFGLFCDHVRNEFRYIHSEQSKGFIINLINHLPHLEKIIPENSVYWRSQIGNDWEPNYINGQHLGDRAIPFKEERMKPLQYRASEGRANPKGIPYLYLASDPNTSISECRPWKSAIITVSQFKTSKQLRLVDLTSYSLEDYPEIDDDLTDDDISKIVLTSIASSFSHPVTNSESSADYIPTQILSELFKSKEFDGVLYRSSLAQGTNLVLFDVDSANLEKSQLYTVEKVDYKYSTGSPADK